MRALPTPVISGTIVEDLFLDSQPVFAGSHNLALWSVVDGHVVGFADDRPVKGFFEALAERNARLLARQARYDARVEIDKNSAHDKAMKAAYAAEQREIERYWDRVYGTGLGGARFDLCLRTKKVRGLNAANAKAQAQAHHNFLVEGFYAYLGDTMFSQDNSFSEEEAFFAQAEAQGVASVTNALRSTIGSAFRKEGLVLTAKQARRLRKKANKVKGNNTPPKARKVSRKHHTSNTEVQVQAIRAAKLIARRERKLAIVRMMGAFRLVSFVATMEVNINLSQACEYEARLGAMLSAQEMITFTENMEVNIDLSETCGYGALLGAMLPAQEMIDYIKEVLS